MTFTKNCEECGRSIGWNDNNEWETPFILEEKLYCYDCYIKIADFSD